ncbi:MAG: hypothetical protein K0Q79_1444 [Flavipsychrobacter sp.]|jgi:outer membrane protein assembly factor BamA|nr:hypothetical protein [Flavipsychrobacter sp.]
MRRSLLVILLVLTSAGSYCQVSDLSAKVKIRKIHIEGNNTTRSKVILRELGIHEGDVIESDSLDALMQQNKLRLFNLQLFNEVNQRTERSGSEINWYISVKERWYIIPNFIVQFADRNFNTWWVKQDHDVRRVMGGVTLTHKNFRGNLEQLAITVQAGYTQKLAISYMRPYVNKGQTNGFGFWASVAQSQQTWYRTDSDKLVFFGDYTGKPILKQIEGGLSYIYRPKYASRHMVQLNYKDYSVGDTILKLNGDYYTNKSTSARFAELFYRYEYNGVDNWNYSLNGFKLVSQFAVRKGFEGIDFQCYEQVEAGIFRRLYGRWYWDAIFRGRVMFPGDQPYYFRGGLGSQTDYVRGYEFYVIDGSQYGLLRVDLKRELFNRTYKLPIKYFTAVPVRIYPKVFADVGYTDGAGRSYSVLSNRFLYSAGIGLDIVTFYDIKIRMEYTWNHLNQNGLYLHFNSE